MIKNLFITTLLALLLFLLNIPYASARGGGGGHALGGLLIFTSPSQNDINDLIEGANTRQGGISTKPMDQAYELTLNYEYRFSGSMFGLSIRPSYFMQSTKGTGKDGRYDYILSGWTFFPVLKIVPLENSFIKFYMMVGLGYGSLKGIISEQSTMVNFSHGTFGGLGGLGAEFCFTDEHCMQLEGTLRYLPFERNIASGMVGSSFETGSLTRAATGLEVEIDNHDLATTMSGVLATIGYIYHF